MAVESKTRTSFAAGASVSTLAGTLPFGVMARKEGACCSPLLVSTVLVDFWTYDCYNCVNTLPYVTKLYETYKDKGLVVVGIHTPEFPFERSAGNVQAALKRHGITYPVAQDNDSATWNAWRNQYWPAQYIVDQHGNIVFSHAGEGQYDEIERTVRRLLNATS